MPPSKIAHYQIGVRIGAGGMGEVFRATDTKLNRDVALKIVPEAFAQDRDRMARFEREAQVLASLNHPNIASIYGLEEQDGTRALVLELVEGSTLSERMAAGPISLREALSIAKQIVEALEAAHEVGIIHRDLKPANVIVTDDGQVKVLDFGLAKALEGGADSDDEVETSPTLSFAATRAGVILGTASYMSPEQARGHKADRRADIWSFGVVLFEMLSGNRLFTGDTPSDVLAQVLTVEPDWEALGGDVSPSIRKLVRRCLTRERKNRLQAIGDARIEIDDYLANPDSPEPGPMPAASTWYPWTASGLLAVGLVASLWFASRSAPEPMLPMRLSVKLDSGGVGMLDPNAQDGAGVALSPDGKT